ncbi:MAG: serine/threonine protein kinase [Planctomycetota bacterium]
MSSTTPTALEQQFITVGGQLGLVDKTAAGQAVQVAAGIRKRGAYADVRTVMLGRRMIRHDDADRVLGKMPEVNQRCPACGSEFRTSEYESDALCPKDGAPLKPQLAPHEAGKTVRPAARPSPGLPPAPLPPSQRKASKGSSPTSASGVQDDPMVGKVFGNFRLLGLVSTSPTSNVYEARLASGGDLPFAVKVQRSTDATRRRRFMREARLAALIDHPNVISIIEVGEALDHLYLAMEYVSGHNLLTIIEHERGGMDAIESVSIGLAMLDGLEAAHQLGIVHRDLKPQNVIVGQLDVKIADFGSARHTDESAQSGMLTANNATVGTAAYMAPEQLETPKVDYRADLYAFGSTLYHMLTGTIPFDGRNAMDVAMAKMQHDAPSMTTKKAGISPALDAVVLSLLQRDPAARPQSALLAAKALQKAMS